jgi:succinate-semialdehyde dehydrogenase/glutarate-semialdehyde dehydrogenase
MIEIRDSSLLLDSCLVDGAWVKSVSKKTMKVTNPATGAEVGEVPELSKSEIEIAIASAYTSQKPWAQLPARERSAVLRSWFNLILENVEDLAVIMTADWEGFSSDQP